MRHNPKIIIISYILLIFFSIQYAQAKSYLHPGTKIVFPDTIAGFQQINIHNYGEKFPGLGVGLAYKKAGIKVDVYLYNLKIENIPNGINSNLIREHFGHVINDIYIMEKKGRYHSIKKLTKQDVFLGNYPALSASFSFFTKEEKRRSYIYLMGYKNYFFKIRFTYLEFLKRDGDASLTEFLDVIGILLAREEGEKVGK
jgi:hypothetical protein